MLGSSIIKSTKSYNTASCISNPIPKSNCSYDIKCEVEQEN